MAVPSFKFTIAESAFVKKQYREMHNTPDGFIKALVARGHKIGQKDGTAIVLARFNAEKHYLIQKNIEEVTGLALDFDGKSAAVDVEAILAKLPYLGVAHSSYSHTPESPRFRVLIPFAEPISIQEHNRLWWWIFEQTDRQADPSGKNPDRLFYLPRAPNEAALTEAWVRELEGDILDHRKVVPAGYTPPAPTLERPRRQAGAHRAPAETRTYASADPQQLLERLATTPLITWACENPSEVSREAWRGIATNIAAAVLEDESAHDDGAALFHEISEYDESRYNYNVTEKTFRDALRSAQDYGPTTFQHLITNGVPEAVCADKGLGAKSLLGLVRMTTRPSKPTPAPVAAPAPTTPPVPTPAPVAALVAAPADDDVLTLDFSRILFDLSSNQWRRKDDAGNWHAMTPAAFNEFLNNQGVPPKRLAAVRAQFAQFQYSAPVWDSPGQELVRRDGVNVFNTYRPSTLEPKPGNWDLVRELLENLCGDDKPGVEYVLDWLAAPVQSLRKDGKPLKMGTALVFHGDPGSGKGTLSLIMEAIYGAAHAVTIGQNELDNRFNGEMLDRLFVTANEIISSTNRSGETANKIKPWITDPTISIEQKFMGSKSVKNEFNIIFTSNDERPVIIEKQDRRYSVFRSTKLDPAMGQALHDDLQGPRNIVAAFLDHLLNRKTTLRYGQLYLSEARQEMIEASAPSEERFVKAVLEDGWLSVSAAWIDNAPNGKIREPIVNDGFVLSTTLREVYEDFCRRNGIRPRGHVYLGKAMKALETVKDDRQYYGNVRQRGWVGVPLRSPNEPAIKVDAPEPTKPLVNNI